MSGRGIAPATGVAARGRAGRCGPGPLRRRQRHGRASVLASLVAALALSSCAAGSSKDPAPAPAPAGTAKWDAASGPATFLSVTELGQLELRSSADGALLKVIYPASRAAYVSAARVAEDTLILAHSSACRATLEEVNTSTGHRRVIRTMGNAVSGLTVSPDGRTAAFVTTPAPCATPSPPGSEGGTAADAFASFLPSVLAVTPLAGGPVVTAATDMPGHPLTHVSWSPDGTRIAATYLGDTPQVLLFSASHPSFATASRLAAPTGCAYFFPVWTRAGLIVVKGCGPDPTLSPSALVRLAPGGKANASWPLPACVNGITGAADASSTHVLLSLNVGYGTDVCDKGHVHRVVMLARQGLRVVLDVPYNREGLDVVDW